MKDYLIIKLNDIFVLIHNVVILEHDGTKTEVFSFLQ